jgi:hypothetical protein
MPLAARDLSPAENPAAIWISENVVPVSLIGIAPPPQAHVSLGEVGRLTGARKRGIFGHPAGFPDPSADKRLNIAISTYIKRIVFI